MELDPSFYGICPLCSGFDWYCPAFQGSGWHGAHPFGWVAWCSQGICDTFEKAGYLFLFICLSQTIMSRDVKLLLPFMSESGWWPHSFLKRGWAQAGWVLESTKVRVVLLLLCNTFSPRRRWSFLCRWWPYPALWGFFHVPEGLPYWGVVDHRWEKHRWHHGPQDKSHTKVTSKVNLHLYLFPCVLCGCRHVKILTECVVSMLIRSPSACTTLWWAPGAPRRRSPDLDSVISYRWIWGRFVNQFTSSFVQVLVVMLTAGGVVGLIKQGQTILFRVVYPNSIRDKSVSEKQRLKTKM